MERVHRDLRVLKIFDFIFLFIAFFLICSTLWVAIQLAALPGIEQHVDQIVVRMVNHENRLSDIEQAIR